MSKIKKFATPIIWLVVLAAVSIAATMTQQQWMPHTRTFADYILNRKSADDADDDHEIVAEEGFHGFLR